jgi:hypothetical protein
MNRKGKNCFYENLVDILKSFHKMKLLKFHLMPVNKAVTKEIKNKHC